MDKSWYNPEAEGSEEPVQMTGDREVVISSGLQEEDRLTDGSENTLTV